MYHSFVSATNVDALQDKISTQAVDTGFGIRSLFVLWILWLTKGGMSSHKVCKFKANNGNVLISGKFLSQYACMPDNNIYWMSACSLVFGNGQDETYHNDRPNLALIPLDPLRPEQISWLWVCPACFAYCGCWYSLSAVTNNTKLTTMTGQIWHWFHLTHLDLSKSVGFASVQQVVAIGCWWCLYGLFAVTINTKLTTMTGQIWHWFHLTHLDLSKSVDFESVQHVVAYCGCWCSLFAVTINTKLTTMTGPNLALIPLDPLRPEQISWLWVCPACCCSLWMLIQLLCSDDQHETYHNDRPNLALIPLDPLRPEQISWLWVCPACFCILWMLMQLVCSDDQHETYHNDRPNLALISLDPLRPEQISWLWVYPACFCILWMLMQLVCSDDQHETYHNDRPNLALIPLDPLRPEQISWLRSCQAGCCMFVGCWWCWYSLFAVTINTKLTTMTGQIWHWFHLTHLDLSKSVDFESVQHVFAYCGCWCSLSAVTINTKLTTMTGQIWHWFHLTHLDLSKSVDFESIQHVFAYCGCWCSLFAVTINTKLTTMTGPNLALIPLDPLRPEQISWFCVCPAGCCYRMLMMFVRLVCGDDQHESYHNDRPNLALIPLDPLRPEQISWFWVCPACCCILWMLMMFVRLVCSDDQHKTYLNDRPNLALIPLDPLRPE